MKFCIQAHIKCGNPAKRDALAQAVDKEIEGKATWGETKTLCLVYDGIPVYALEIRFENEVDMDKLFSSLKDKIGETSISTGGEINKHYCFHDEGNSTEKSCEIIERFER